MCRMYGMVKILVFFLLLFILSSCVSTINMSSMQTAQIIPHKERQLLIGLGYYPLSQGGTIFLEALIQDAFWQNTSVYIKSTVTSITQVGVKSLVFHNDDIDVSFGGYIGFMSEESGIDIDGNIISSYYYDTSLVSYFSYRLTEIFTMYSNLTYLYRTISETEINTEHHFALSIGSKIGKDMGVYIEGTQHFTQYSPMNQNSPTQFGVGVFF